MWCGWCDILSILRQIVYNIYREFQDLRGWARCGIVKLNIECVFYSEWANKSITIYSIISVKEDNKWKDKLLRGSDMGSRRW